MLFSGLEALLASTPVVCDLSSPANENAIPQHFLRPMDRSRIPKSRNILELGFKSVWLVFDLHTALSRLEFGDLHRTFGGNAIEERWQISLGCKGQTCGKVDLGGGVPVREANGTLTRDHDARREISNA